MGPHEIIVAHGITFDLGAGIGARVPSRYQDAPAELPVLMRPSIFLMLATPLPAPRTSLTWIRAQITAGEAICPPMLRLWLPSARNGVPAVTAHDGRHRALALRDLAQDAHVPVRIELPGLSPDENVPAWAIAAVRRRAKAQGGARQIVAGPLFELLGDDADTMVAHRAAHHQCGPPVAPAAARQADPAASARPGGDWPDGVQRAGTLGDRDRPAAVAFPRRAKTLFRNTRFTIDKRCSR
jgi:hypothetical protein